MPGGLIRGPKGRFEAQPAVLGLGAKLRPSSTNLRAWRAKIRLDIADRCPKAKWPNRGGGWTEGWEDRRTSLNSSLYPT